MQKKKELIKGNIAIAQASLNAGCDCYFGYPITPQTEIGEYLSQKMYEQNKAYVCAESEVAAINMVIGAAATGARAMTSSSSCAVGLMQEALSYACADELPIVLVNVMRAGPGQGYIYPSQGDYNQAVYGGGNGDYKMIVLAPSTVQECIDLTYKAFYLAQAYRNPTMILADGLLGQMMEPASYGAYSYPEVDTSTWALTGAKNREARIIRSLGPEEDAQVKRIYKLFDKYKKIEEEVTDWEEINVEGADIILVAFGSMFRAVKATMVELEKKGLKVGVFRPISLSPFPHKRLLELSKTTKDFFVVEMNMGQMAKDVRYAIEGNAKVSQINRPVGQFLSVEEIMQEVEHILGEKVYASI